MPPTPRPTRIRSSMHGTQSRALWARTNASFAVNSPAGFPSAYPPGVPAGPGSAMWWVGSDDPGAFLHPTEAPALAIVNRATALICDPIAQSPLKVVDEANGQPLQGTPLPTPTWLRDPMLTRDDRRIAGPDDTFPAVLKLGRAKFWNELLRGALWFGMCGLLFSEDAEGQPQAGTLKIINPLLLGTERADDDSLRWVIGTGPNDSDRVVFGRDGRVTLGPVGYRLVVLRNPASPVDEEGRSMGVFEMSPAAFRLERSVGNYTASTFKSGVPSGYLKSDTPNMTQESAEALRNSWLRHHGGDVRSVAILSSTVSFTPISMSPIDAALGEVRRLSAAEVAWAFSIDANMLGAGLQNSASYNNVRDYFKQHRDLGIGMWISSLQDLLSALLPGSQAVRVDTDAFTRPEPGERYAAYGAALDSGWITVDEVRALEGMGPMSSTGIPEKERNLSAAEVSQKVYLAVQAGVLSIEEARRMIVEAGGKLDPAAVPVPEGGDELPEPTGTEGVRSLRSPTWRR